MKYLEEAPRATGYTQFPGHKGCSRRMVTKMFRLTFFLPHGGKLLQFHMEKRGGQVPLASQEATLWPQGGPGPPPRGGVWGPF